MEGPAQAGCEAMERVGPRGTPERRWRKGIYGRVSQTMNGRACRTSSIKVPSKYLIQNKFKIKFLATYMPYLLK